MKRLLISLIPLCGLAVSAQTVPDSARADSMCVAFPADSVIPAADSVTAVADTAAPRAAKTKYLRNTARYQRDWSRIVPNQTTMQFAGSIGAYAIGLGWHYGRKQQWETELLFGYVPKKNGGEEHFTFTAKQRYVPWRLPLSSRWAVEPLTTGFFINSIFGEGFWDKEPSKYTHGYYGFSTKIRYNIFVGQRVVYNIPTRHRRFNRSITFYYELSTCDLYVVSAVPNKNVGLGDILSLALGVKMEMF